MSFDTGWQKSTVLRIERRTDRIKSVFFEPSVPFEHKAGQHIDLRLTAPDGYRAIRSYSIASAPSVANPIELAIERLDNGEVSPFFHDVAKAGDEIEIRGPLGGHFIWSAKDDGPVLLIGGASGVVPLMSMLRASVLHAGVSVTLVHSSREWENVLFREELLRIEREVNGISVVFALTRDVARRRDDFSRRIDGPMIDEILARKRGVPKHVFVCGANAFVNAAVVAVTSNGIEASRVRTERYGI